MLPLMIFLFSPFPKPPFSLLPSCVAAAIENLIDDLPLFQKHDP